MPSFQIIRQDLPYDFSHIPPNLYDEKKIPQKFLEDLEELCTENSSYGKLGIFNAAQRLLRIHQ